MCDLQEEACFSKKNVYKWAKQKDNPLSENMQTLWYRKNSGCIR